MINRLEEDLKSCNNPELVLTVDNIADLLEIHPTYQVAHPDHAPSPELLREKANGLRSLVNAGDQAKGSETNAAREELLLFAGLPAAYLNTVSVLRNDPSILQNTGYAIKGKRSRTASNTTPPPPPTGLQVTQSEVSGTLCLSGHKPRANLSCEIQICKGEPLGESSWLPFAMRTGCRKIEVSGLEPGQKYFFRMRSHGPGGHGPWSAIVSRMVI